MPRSTAPRCTPPPCSPRPIRSTPTRSPRRRRPSPRRSSGYDRVFMVGAHGFVVYPYHPGSVLPPHVELVQLSPDPSSLGRFYPTRLAVLGDPRATLEALLPLVSAQVDAEPPASRSTSEAPPVASSSTRWRPRPSAATTPRPPSRWPQPTRCCGPCPNVRRWSTRPSPPGSSSAASTTSRPPTATSSARAAGWAGACRSPSASPSASAASPRSAWSVTGRRCTPARPCGRRPTATCRSCSPWSTTAST